MAAANFLATDVVLSSKEPVMCQLLSPMPFGAINLSHRVVATAEPLFRAGHSLDAILRYYQRLAVRGGLLFAEPVSVSESALPSISAESDIQVWRRLADEIRDKGGRSILPLCHGSMAREERPAILEAFINSARYAKLAGFDGVEIDAGCNWLLERCVGLLLDIAEGVYSVWGKGRIGIRLGRHDPLPLLALAKGMNRFERCFIHIVGDAAVAGQVRQVFQGPIIVATDLDNEGAEKLIASRQVDLVRLDAPPYPWLEEARRA